MRRIPRLTFTVCWALGWDHNPVIPLCGGSDGTGAGSDSPPSYDPWLCYTEELSHLGLAKPNLNLLFKNIITEQFEDFWVFRWFWASERDWQNRDTGVFVWKFWKSESRMFMHADTNTKICRENFGTVVR